MALTEIPSELSSTPSIADSGNDTAITIGSDESVTLAGTLSLPNANATNEISFTGTEFTNVLSATTGGFQLGTTGAGYLQFLTGNTARMTIDGGTGNVGIRQTNPSAFNALGGKQVVIGSGAETNTLTLFSDDTVDGNGYGHVAFADSNVSSSTAQYAGLIQYFHGDNTMRFYTASTERLRILPTGGITFNGDTAQANALDSYEEGSWTPTLVGYYGNLGTTFTQGTRNGVYTRVGNIVTLGMEISSAGVAAANNTDIVAISGLPFNIGGYGIVGSHVHTSAASKAGGGWTSISSNKLGHLGNSGVATSAWAWMRGSGFATSAVAIRLTITYRVA